MESARGKNTLFIVYHTLGQIVELMGNSSKEKPQGLGIAG